MDIQTFLTRYAAEFIQIRRRLHQLAELSTLEYETGAYLMHLLDQWGIPYEYPVAETGLTATIYGKNVPGKVVALRADMDALPIFEDDRCPFHSKNPGVMHACGHDAHMTIALGAARYFKEKENDFSGCIRIFFQPAEETIGGAQRMIDAGCMEDPAVDAVIGLHMAPYLETGTIELKHGKLYAASDEVSIVLHGKSSHGAYPDTGVDAIVIAAHLITALQTIASRSISPLDQYVLTLGTIRGGSAHNIIADTVELSGALRTTDPSAREQVKKMIRRQVEGIPASMGGSGTVTFTPGYDALINTDAMVDLLENTAIPILGKKHVLRKEYPGMGVEDFSFFLHKAPGVFYHLGCGKSRASRVACSSAPGWKHLRLFLPQQGAAPVRQTFLSYKNFRGNILNKKKSRTAPLHSREFSLDEDSLALGIHLQIMLAERILLS